MNKEEKINKIIEMTKEIINLLNPSEKEIDKLYIETKISLDAYKEFEGEDNE